MLSARNTYIWNCGLALPFATAQTFHICLSTFPLLLPGLSWLQHGFEHFGIRCCSSRSCTCLRDHPFVHVLDVKLLAKPLRIIVIPSPSTSMKASDVFCPEYCGEHSTSERARCNCLRGLRPPRLGAALRLSQRCAMALRQRRPDLCVCSRLKLGHGQASRDSVSWMGSGLSLGAGHQCCRRVRGASAEAAPGASRAASADELKLVVAGPCLPASCDFRAAEVTMRPRRPPGKSKQLVWPSPVFTKPKPKFDELVWYGNIALRYEKSAKKRAACSLVEFPLHRSHLQYVSVRTPHLSCVLIISFHFCTFFFISCLKVLKHVGAPVIDF